MSAEIDRVLAGPVESGKLPGVVGLVASDSGIVYQGAFGRRAGGRARLDDQGDHCHGGDAAR